MTDRSRQHLILRLIPVVFLLFSSSVFAGKPIAEVYRVFGKATQLRPGDLIARRLVQGDKIPVDTSIVTSKKSFVQIVYYNGGSVNVGPSSKIVITQTSEKKKGVVGLLKGKIRANFTNPSVRKSKNLKFFVKTKSAAMGVRGTDFQAIYNPENHVSNLITFEGEVSMAKVEVERKNKSAKRKSRKKRKRSRKRRLKKSIYQKNVDEVEVDLEVEEIEFSDKQIEQFIDNSDEAVKVLPGQFAGSMPALDRVSEPVKISPVQFAALKRNSGLMEKKDRKLIKAAELDKVNLAKFPRAAEQKAPPEGFFDPSTGKYAPKAGGFVDLKTGLYVQPSTHASYNEKLGLYVENGLGSVDQETGQYLPPKGLKLHPNKGFIPSTKKNAKNKKVIAMAKQINEEIALKSLVTKNVSTEKLVDSAMFSEQELYSKNILTIQYLMGSQSSSTTGDTILGDGEYASTSRSGYRINWDIASNSFWRPFAFFEKQDIELDKDGKAITDIDPQPTGAVEVGAGLKFYHSDRLTSFASFGFDQHIMLQHYRDDQNTAQSVFDRLTRFRLLGGADYSVIRSRRYSLNLIGHLAFMPTASKETSEFGAGFAYGLKAYFKYWYKRDIQINLGLEFETLSMELVYPDVTYDHSVTQLSPVLSLTKVF